MILLVCLTGCSDGLWGPKTSKKTARTGASTRRGTYPSPSRSLRLFGAAGTRTDVVFEGKAAVDFKQHSFPAEGDDFDPEVSPSGKHLVFASTRHSKSSHLYLKAVGGAAVTQITDGPGSDVQPVIDPTGTRIAFSSSRSGNWDIWIIDVDGRNPMQVTDGPMPELHPSWSPDGEHLVYCRIDTRENRSQLWVAKLCAPGVRRLIGDGMFPAWSPSGNHIAYQRARERGSRWFSIWTLEYKNDEPRLPTEIVSSTRAAMIAPAWSPDGRQLTFAAVMPAKRSSAKDGPPRTRPGHSRVCMVDADGRGLQYLTDSRGESYSPTWGPDGRIYFTASIDDTESIWSVQPFRPPLPGPPTKTVEHEAAEVGRTVKDG